MAPSKVGGPIAGSSGQSDSISLQLAFDLHPSDRPPMNHPSPFGNPSPFGGPRPFDGSSLLDRFHGKPVGEVRFPTAAAPPRPAVDPDYLRKVSENDPWPEGSSCATYR